MNRALQETVAGYIQELVAQGVFRRPAVLESRQGPRIRVKGKELINLASNNYLGLASHPRLVEASIKATRELGVGSGAVRTIAGTLDIHEDLERRLARFKGAEAALLLQSGFTANMAVIEPLLTGDDVIISDQLNHASIIEGIRLSRAQRRVFPHGDMAALEAEIKACSGHRLRLVVTDGVFSMDGDIANLPEIVRLAEAYDASVMVDDAHGSGVLGRCGRGTVDHFGLSDRVDIQVGTLSKAVGVLGGYVVGSKDLIDYLVHRGRPFLFSTSHPPGVVAACLAALDLLEEGSLQEHLWENTRYFKQGLANLGFDTGNSETPITPVIVGEDRLAMAFSDALFEEGIFCTGIAYPTVPKGKSRVRTIVMATHTKEDLDQALDAFSRAGRGMGII